MKELKNQLSDAICTALNQLYQLEVPSVELQLTRKEFTGDLTLVVFPFVRASKQSPEVTAQQIGSAVKEITPLVAGFNVVKGFLNLEVNPSYWMQAFAQIAAEPNFGAGAPSGQKVVVEYSSPNTNKPLHLGHIRNNLLGWSVSEILKTAGHEVIKVQVINDRGIHICKSMVAWQKFGKGETPESSGLKGDKLVGKYYVAFDQAFRQEVKELMEHGKSKEEAEAQAPILLEAREMLQKWEAQDPATIQLWETMNQWVYAGFNTTYAALGVDFHKNYYESETYKLGKSLVEEGLEKGVFYRREDGSVWVDLTADGLDEKLLLRSDGTSVYMTQDLGTALQRYEDFGMDAMVYTVGNEQDYHFKVLFLILSKLGYPWAQRLFHLSYGMVDLPSGKMKSREGTVVDADDLIEEMTATAKQLSEELGKVEGLAEPERNALYHTLGLGALKYFILKVDPRKRMMFDPNESIDFNGNTGPFLQYTHARISSLVRKGEAMQLPAGPYALNHEEQELIKTLLQFPEVVQEAAAQYEPSHVAQYAYELVKKYNGFYQQHHILTDAQPGAAAFRLNLSKQVRKVLASSLHQLGISSPERM